MEGGSSRVPFPPLAEIELLDMSVEQFLSSLHFDQKRKIDQLGIDLASFDLNLVAAIPN